jgi:hypothetical protein
MVDKHDLQFLIPKSTIQELENKKVKVIDQRINTLVRVKKIQIYSTAIDMYRTSKYVFHNNSLQYEQPLTCAGDKYHKFVQVFFTLDKGCSKNWTGGGAVVFRAHSRH